MDEIEKLILHLLSPGNPAGIKKKEELISALRDLNSRVEMSHVKTMTVRSIKTILFKGKIKRDKDFGGNMLHMIITGPPGVGKSAVAKILARIWYNMGVIKFDDSSTSVTRNDIIFEKVSEVISFTDRLYEIPVPNLENLATLRSFAGEIKKKCGEIARFYEPEDSEMFWSKSVVTPYVVAGREDVVGEYQGHTSIKCLDYLMKNRGRVVIFEEAYSLWAGETDHYGSEALAVINRFMDEHSSEIIIIFIGYGDKIIETLFRCQPGLQRRFQTYFEFSGYSPEGLKNIFLDQMGREGWEVSAKDKDLSSFFAKKISDFTNFGGDTQKLVFQCVSEYCSEHCFSDEVDSNPVLEWDIFERAYTNFLKNRDISKKGPPEWMYS